MAKHIRIDDLKEFTVNALSTFGVAEKQAKIAAEVLVTTDLFGISTHGTKNLLGYIEKIKAGGINPKAELIIEKEGPSYAVINANAALGMVSSTMAMNIAIQKAKESCISYVTVHNSCHFGAAGYYSNLAANNKMIGIAMSNTDPNMSVPGSCGIVIGNNPISYAVPISNGGSVFLDIALSSVAGLKVAAERDLGHQVPLDWIIDTDGNPTSDPSGFPYSSFLQPMSRHKGYGLAVLVEVLSAILSGSGFLSEVKSWNLDYASINNVGHTFIVIDIGQIMEYGLFEKRMVQLIEELKNAPLAPGNKEILLPGELEWARRKGYEKNGIVSLPDDVADNLEKVTVMVNNPLQWI